VRCVSVRRSVNSSIRRSSTTDPHTRSPGQDAASRFRAPQAALARFRDTHTLDVLIDLADLADLPTTRFEAKASYVLLSMVGASAKVPAISTLVEHGGLARLRRRDGTEDVLVLRPRTTVVQTAHPAGLHRDPNRQRPRGPELLGPRRGGRVAGQHRAR
jgi:hypothetical protein